MRLVAAFFGDIKGYYVEVGANDPRARSQTWHLEQRGWTGVLIEPQPDLAARLRAERKGEVFAVACSSPAKAGQELPLHVAGPLSSLDRRSMAPGATPETSIRVPVRTLDSILEQAGSPAAFDFLSIDVEGHEIEVLQGFDLVRWRPRLIMIEDHVADLSKHRYLNAAGYRIIRRYENNGWYVPNDSPVACRMIDRWEILRKYYLALPFRMLRNLSRQVRKPVRD
jgi:FkbM family methyltransferase